MRIPKNWIPYIANNIIENLLKKDMIELVVSKEQLLEEAEKLILDELMVEDKLNEEIRGLLKKYESEIEKSKVDYRKLFEMTKQKLVKQRNLVL
ncbi:MAG TPA: DUF507 family protein [Thermodesulfovibrio thiophilus]|uniref:DUF507 family protein n=1 Tax=Thermodesulfovibrio thiophilus TaxID=340095 RepID=UPI00041A6918|nr:DUF507 family protein [Thermodesulfovibrio thiophilus]HHW19819.1 DUF507 family protein [Thermodesulfovibrio thiophilus]HOA82582.1 DUF507 family protein [Thermodesulfovibrio thiophilus]HQA03212.1 DUF507 family protein [Thermodesulfovibrio thiophilus]HQD35574.1 DUF507 family protein [Thermodesulfovibrio thiophilus]